MKLYHVRRLNNDCDWDEANGFIVRAMNEKEARELAASDCGSEGKEVWLDPKKTGCKVLQNVGETEIIMQDFCAG